MDQVVNLPAPNSFLAMQDDSKYSKFIEQLTKIAEAKTETIHFVLIGGDNQHALDFFGLKKEDTPGFVIQTKESKFIKKNVSPKDAATFYKDFKVNLA